MSKSDSHFILDNSGTRTRLSAWAAGACGEHKALDIATGRFEISGLLALKDAWPKAKAVRVLIGGDVSLRTQSAFEAAVGQIAQTLDRSLEEEKETNAFLTGVPAIVDALKTGRIHCRVYRKARFHAKTYIVRDATANPATAEAAVGSSNLTKPGLEQNVELNVRLEGLQATTVAEWFDEHWADAEDVSPKILEVIERHVRLYAPFDVYAKSLTELFRDAPTEANEWDERDSRMFKALDGYQQVGYRSLMRIAEKFGGALLCDGVGLGKTFIGLMLIERLIVFHGSGVVLLAPKGAVDSVWRPLLEQYLPRISAGGTGIGISRLAVMSHTDLALPKNRRVLENLRYDANAVIVDEAHHFRNMGSAGTGAPFVESARKAVERSLYAEPPRRSRYRELFDLISSPSGGGLKKLFMLTATPINNSFHDLRHMIELFTQKNEQHFATSLGIHSLTAHFKRMEAQIDGDTRQAPLLTDSEDAKSVLAADPLVGALVVQRSRSYVKQKQEEAGVPVTAFPPREPPHRVDYSLKKVYGALLDLLDQAFDKDEPLFTLAPYYKLHYYKHPKDDFDPGDENRQKAVVALVRTSFLKRFESSVAAFRASCDRLLIKLLAWATANVETSDEKQTLADWRQKNIKLVDAIRQRQPDLFKDPSDPAGAEDFTDDEADEDIAGDEFANEAETLDRRDFRVGDMLTATFADLDQLRVFYDELNRFDHRNDDKLKTLVRSLRKDPSLAGRKVLIFTEFADTADYLLERLTAEKVDSVVRIDSRTKGRDRLNVIKRFSPYYNGQTSATLAEQGQSEIRVLISTDVLSEGLNLQDATRLINYDLHWNPVRLMQRIGRVDRRRNPNIEPLIAADHPEWVEGRKNVAYYNFLPPPELNRLLTLYRKVTGKTLRISRTLGIEGKKLLAEDDDYQDLQNFNEAYEGGRTAMEQLDLEKDRLFRADPTLADRVEALPARLFSGRRHPTADARAVFFCYRLPVQTGDTWSTDAGPCRWYLYDLATATIADTAPAIADVIRSTPTTPRQTKLPDQTLSDAKGKVESLIRNSYLRSVQAPVGVKPMLVAWMELN